MMDNLKDFLRPAKYLIMDVLVDGKRFWKFTVFRLTRFFTITQFLMTHTLPKRISPNWNRKHRIKNGMTPRLGLFSFVLFALFKSNRLHLVLLNSSSDSRIFSWINNLKHYLQISISYPSEGTSVSSWMDTRREFLSVPSKAQVLIIDAKLELPSVMQILELMHALNNLDPLVELGAVHPAYSMFGQSIDKNIPGFSYNSSNKNWEDARNDEQFSRGIFLDCPSMCFHMVSY